jgi:hypothetical protein
MLSEAAEKRRRMYCNRARCSRSDFCDNGLGVGGSRVDPFGEALGGWDPSERLVRAGGVVSGQERGQRAAASGAGRVGGGVGPFA